MNFNGAGVTVNEGRPGKNIKPGIHKARIKEVNYGTSSQKGTPYIEFVHETPPVDGLTDEANNPIGQVAKTTMWMSPKAWDNDGNPNGQNWCTKAKLTIMADKLGLKEQFDAITATSPEEFVTKARALFVGKVARWAFGGEERTFTNDSGETINYIRPSLLSYGFVENTTDVPNDSDTKLKFDESKHIKKQETPDMDNTGGEPVVPQEENAPW